MSRNQLRLFLCGRLAIDAGSVVVREADLPARQGRRLWAYLVLHRRRPVGRDDLAGALWGDAIPDAWDSTLNALASRLRRSLSGVASAVPTFSLRGEPGRYALTLPPDTFVDLERARAGMHECDRLMRGGEIAAALAEARVALEIAGRGFLSGEEAPWIEGVRRTLGDIRLNAYQRTVEAEIQRGRLDLAEAEARVLLGLEPLHEPGYRLLMRTLAARGNPGQAIRVYEQCRRTLREQVAATPSRATDRLLREIVASSE
jgi:DNA-binding SARP family transcriptional activator